jgi:hypothetical protein
MIRPNRLQPTRNTWLLARDLRDAPALAVGRLAQHHVAAHSTWGVSFGLEVLPDAGRVRVTAGAAIDRCGRVAVLSRPVTIPVAAGQAVSVVLAARGVGPSARVLLRAAEELGEGDVPLATVDAAGVAHSRDGDRQWLRRPGPGRTLSGLVPRGATATGQATEWRVHVDLLRELLDGTPAVVATPAGAPPFSVAYITTGGAAMSHPVVATTIAVSDIDPAGFELVVRHHIGAAAGGSPAPVRTTPLALAWLAFLPADRPDLPTTKEGK